MSATIDMTDAVDKDRSMRSILVWAVLNLLDRDFEKVFKGRSSDGHFMLDVELWFNGVEVDFVKLLNMMDEGRQYQVEQMANELIDEKVSCLNDILEQAKRKIREDLHLPLNDEDRW